ncbi:MAG: Uncharacterised protein [Bacteroidetes bacterium MED-G17]|nr:MAG: Uncharacterised protein [Bacteroidetes bacterium MED-G17]
MKNLKNKGSFLGNLFLLNILNLLIKPAWLLLADRKVQILLEAENYGLFYRGFNFVLLLNILLDFGINNYTSKEIASNQKFIGKFFRKLLIIKLLLSIVFLALVVLISPKIGHSTQLQAIIFIMAFYQIFLSFFQFFRSITVGFQQFRIDAFFSVLEKGFLLITLLIILYIPHYTQYLSAQFYAKIHLIIIVALAIVLGVYIVQKFNLLSSQQLSEKKLGEILKKTTPFALLGILMTLYTRLDVFMIGQLTQRSEFWVAQYVKGFRLLDALNMLFAISAGFLLPLFSKYSKDERWMRINVVAFFELFLWFVAPSVIFAFATKGEIIKSLYGDKDWVIAAESFGILIWVFLAMSLVYVFGTALTAMGKLKQLNMIAGLTVLLNFALNLYYIPRHGIIGAALVTLFSQSIFGGFCLLLTQKKSGLQWHWVKNLKLILLLLLVFFSTKYLQFNQYAFFKIVVIEIALYIVISILLGLIPKRESFVNINKQ